MQLVGGLRSGLECRSAHGLQAADHLDRAVTGFRLSGGCASLHRTGGCLGIDWV
jgi:hypothetical protein